MCRVEPDGHGMIMKEAKKAKGRVNKIYFRFQCQLLFDPFRYGVAASVSRLFVCCLLWDAFGEITQHTIADEK